jgi:hypothetical protein
MDSEVSKILPDFAIIPNRRFVLLFLRQVLKFIPRQFPILIRLSIQQVRDKIRVLQCQSNSPEVRWALGWVSSHDMLSQFLLFTDS